MLKFFLVTFLLSCVLVATQPTKQCDDDQNNEWQQNDLDHIDKVVNDFMASWGVVGSSLALIKDGRLVYAKGYGVKDLDTNEPVQVSTLFRIASVSKPVTATTLMKMIENDPGLLNRKIFGADGILGTEYGTPSFYDPYVYQITVKHLLEHTAGGYYWSNEGHDPTWNYYHLYDSSPELIGWVLDTKNINNPPGQDYYYSNFEYCLLGRVIEKLSNGMSYESYVQENLLKPCGVSKNMQIGSSHKYTNKKEATYYSFNDASPYYPEINVPRMDADGGWIGSTIDLARFLVCVDGSDTKPDIISKSTWNLMTAPTSESGYTYAKGWGTCCNGNIFHSGSFQGTGSEVWINANGISLSF